MGFTQYFHLVNNYRKGRANKHIDLLIKMHLVSSIYTLSLLEPFGKVVISKYCENYVKCEYLC